MVIARWPGTRPRMAHCAGDEVAAQEPDRGVGRETGDKGVALLTRSPGNAGILLTTYKASFIVWAALTVVHLLGHVVDGLRLTVHDWQPARGVTGPRGRATRRCLVLLTLLVGVGVAATFTPTNHWSGQQAPGEQQHQHER